MKGLEVNKTAMTLLMIGLLVVTFFLPLTNPTKIKSKKLYVTVINGLDNDNSATNNQTQNQTALNLIEEEAEYTTETFCKVGNQSPILITISFSSPNLFFTEHCGEVSGPPPWS